jgi:hypothetical protein
MKSHAKVIMVFCFGKHHNAFLSLSKYSEVIVIREAQGAVLLT